MSTPKQAGLCGLVLGGGDSSRMGRDKALIVQAGEAWWARQQRVLAAAGAGTIWLSRRPGQPCPAHAMCIHDMDTDMGPIAGLRAGLSRAPSPHLAVLAADMPLLDPGWFEALLARCENACGAVFEHQGFLEPLAAVYPSTAAEACARAIAEGRFSLQGLCRGLAAAGALRILPLPAQLARHARSINTPGALKSLEGRQRRRPGA